MVPYLQLVNQQENNYLDHGCSPFLNFLFSLLGKYMPSIKSWNKRFEPAVPNFCLLPQHCVNLFSKDLNVTDVSFIC